MSAMRCWCSRCRRPAATATAMGRAARVHDAAAAGRSTGAAPGGRLEGSAGQEHDMFGTIKKILRDKGFGFITPDDGSDDVFFHRSRLAPKVNFEDLREGEEVEFQS